MRLIQFEDRAGQRRVGVVEGAGIQVLRGVRSTRELGLAAIRAGSGLHDEVLRRGSEPGPDYAGLLEEGRVLPPLDHDDPAHCLVSGTGLTHLGSAATRDRMHQQNQGDETALTDTMRIFRWGLAALHAHPHVRHLAGQPQEGRQARPQLFQADVSLLLEGDELLQEEVFGPASVVVEVADHAELKRALHGLHGQLTATLIAEAEDLASFADLVPLLEQKAGRLLLNGYPTGVEVCDAMVHGGPYPATSDARGTSVGTLAIDRFLRPVCYQNYPDAWLPEALKDGNPLGIARLVDGVGTRAAID